jgi:hypothetical protein
MSIRKFCDVCGKEVKYLEDCNASMESWISGSKEERDFCLGCAGELEEFLVGLRKRKEGDGREA